VVGDSEVVRSRHHGISVELSRMLGSFRCIQTLLAVQFEDSDFVLWTAMPVFRVRYPKE